MSLDVELIPTGTLLTANGDGAAHDVSSSHSRTFLCSMTITGQIEQESIDLSIWGSHDGREWGNQPLLKMPQRFYRGETRQVLELTRKLEIRYLRAKWELNRWGRVTPHPRFVLGFRLTEVSAFARESAVPAS